ncbi:MAG: hypothetical protein ACPL0B_01475, partial [Anaerolineales bacterium]
MNIIQVILLVTIGFGMGFIQNNQLWKSLLIFISIFLYYWLQPSSSIRNLDFWLPTLTLLIAFLIYLGWDKFSFQSLRKNLFDFIFVFLPTLLISLTRFLPYFNITPTPPPVFTSVVIFLLIAITGIILFIRVIPQQLHYSFTFSLLIILFLFLKIPTLTLWISKAWHYLNHQPVTFSTALDIKWLGISFIFLRMLHLLIDIRLKRQP